jgi:hypothetical protein
VAREEAHGLHELFTIRSMLSSLAVLHTASKMDG